MISTKEFAQKLKNKYPQYQSVPDEDLVRRVLEKYPQYSNQLRGISDEAQNNLFNKAANKASELSQSTFGRAADFLFGSTAKTVGTLGGNLVEDVLNVKKEDKAFNTEDITIKDTAFTALELLPGGALTKLLGKVPGVTRASKAVNSLFSAIPTKLREGAAKNFESILRPTKEVTKQAARDIAPELAKRQVVTATQQGLKSLADESAEVAGKKIDDFLKALPKEKTLKVKPVVDALKKQKEKFIIGGKNIDVAPEVSKGVDDLLETIGQFGDDIPAKDVVELRRAWDTLVSETNGFQKTLKEGSKINLQKVAANSIREELSKEFPDLAKINAEYSFWAKTSQVMEETLKRGTGQSGGLTNKIVAASIGGATVPFGGLTSGVTGFVLAENAMKVIQSTGWKTVSAKLKTKLADAMAKGDADAIQKVLFEIGRRLGVSIGRGE